MCHDGSTWGRTKMEGNKMVLDSRDEGLLLSWVEDCASREDSAERFSSAG